MSVHCLHCTYMHLIVTVVDYRVVKTLRSTFSCVMMLIYSITNIGSSAEAGQGLP